MPADVVREGAFLRGHAPRVLLTERSGNPPHPTRPRVRARRRGGPSRKCHPSVRNEDNQNYTANGIRAPTRCTPIVEIHVGARVSRTEWLSLRGSAAAPLILLYSAGALGAEGDRRQCGFVQRRMLLQRSFCCLLQRAWRKQSRSAPAPAFSAKDLTALPTDRWITNGGNIYNQRYSPLTGINRDNVAQAQAEWRTKPERLGHGRASIPPKRSRSSTTASFTFATGANDVFALDVETGAIRWSHEANLDPEHHGHLLRLDEPRCGDRRRQDLLGPARRQARGARQATARSSGRSRRNAPKTPSASRPHRSITTGSSSRVSRAATARRGRVKAYDARTGELRWTFYTIPGPGEVGHETWPADNDTWEYGGAAVWQTPAVDPELGLVYFSTATPAPISTARCGPATICSASRSSRSRRKPASTAGTSSRSITISGTTTRRIP